MKYTIKTAGAVRTSAAIRSEVRALMVTITAGLDALDALTSAERGEGRGHPNGAAIAAQGTVNTAAKRLANLAGGTGGEGRAIG